MTTAPRKLVVFDWNGTLIDDAEACTAAMNVILQRLARPTIKIDDFRRHFEVPIEHFYRNVGCNDAELARISESQDLFHDTYEGLALEISLRDGALAALKNLGRETSTVILSNHLVEPIQNQLRRLGIDTHFLDVLAYANRSVQFTTIRKGARLASYMKEAGFNPADTVIVGDTPEETHIARELGLTSVAITGGFATEARLIDVKPDFLIHTLHDFLPIMEELRCAA